jgi:hypothetical protein
MLSYSKSAAAPHMRPGGVPAKARVARDTSLCC